MPPRKKKRVAKRVAAAPKKRVSLAQINQTLLSIRDLMDRLVKLAERAEQEIRVDPAPSDDEESPLPTSDDEDADPDESADADDADEDAGDDGAEGEAIDDAA
jgi:hypothetical protein